MNKPILYIIARNDLDSLNPGKLAAQVSHAASLFAFDMETNEFNADINNAYDNWRAETTQGFGTVLVLSDTMERIARNNDAIPDCYPHGIVHDPTYPIRDGLCTHFIPLDTCSYVFVPTTKEDCGLGHILDSPLCP